MTASQIALMAAQDRRHEARCICGEQFSCATPAGLQLLIDSHYGLPGQHFMREVTR